MSKRNRQQHADTIRSMEGLGVLKKQPSRNAPEPLQPWKVTVVTLLMMATLVGIAAAAIRGLAFGH